MEALDKEGCFMDDLLDFASDIGEEDGDEVDHNTTTTNNNNNNNNNKPRKALSSSFNPSPFNVLGPDGPNPSLPEFVEEDLEWLSNKDAFPAVETFVDLLSEHPGSLPSNKQGHSPISVLEINSTTSSSSNNSSNSSNGISSIIMNCCGSLRVPGKARSKRYRRRRYDLLLQCRGKQRQQQQQFLWVHENVKNVKPHAMVSTMGRKCQHCGAEKTPQWRAGPLGPKTLCNACGVRYKSGRLVPEYRPANSPTFSSELHSNSHRKVMEMRKKKQVTGLLVVKPMDKG